MAIKTSKEEIEYMIEINAARCKLCNDTIVSTHRHDYQTCDCGNLSVDGGIDYIRRGYKDLDEIEELSIERKVVDYDNLTQDDMYILLKAYQKWMRIYELSEMDEEAWLGLHARFVDRWLPRLLEEFKPN